MPLTNGKLLVRMYFPAPKDWMDRVAARFPGLEVRWEVTSIEGSSLTSTESLSPDAWDGMTMAFLIRPLSDLEMAGVCFVQLVSAGWDHWNGHPSFTDPNVTFCSASGCHAPQIAEWVMGMWLSHAHHFGMYEEQQKAALWRMRSETPVKDLKTCRMGILGYGAIGRQCAHLAHAFDVEVYAYTKNPRLTMESRIHTGYCVQGTGDVNGLIPAKWFSGDTINDFLAQDLDVLVVSIPLTDSTHHLISHKQFNIMSTKKTFLINVARGPIIDTNALIQALNQGLISGAALDVTDPEPLPDSHPLWDAPNVTITPHISWQSAALPQRALDLLFQNLERLDKGEPLVNTIPKMV